MDDDDYIHEDMLKTLYNLAKDTGSDICTVGSKFVFPDGSTKDKYVYEGQYILNRIEAMFEFLKREKINTSAGGRMYKKELLVNIDLPDLPVVRDIYREYRIFNRIKQATLTGQPMYYFYRHDGNLSGLNTKEQISRDRLADHLRANSMRTQYLSEKMPEIKEYVLYSEYSFMISLASRVRELGIEDCYDLADHMVKCLQEGKTFLQECGYLTKRENQLLKELL